MPHDVATYSYVAYPLQAGFCKLPKLQLKLTNYDLKSDQKDEKNQSGAVESLAKLIHSELNLNESTNSATNNINNSLDLIVQSMIPAQIFIMPNKVNIASST